MSSKSDQVAIFITQITGRYPTAEEIEECMALYIEYEKEVEKIKQQTKDATYEGYSGGVKVVMDCSYWVREVKIGTFYFRRNKIEKDIKEAMNQASVETSRGVKIYNNLIEVEQTKLTLNCFKVLGITDKNIESTEEEYSTETDKNLN